MVVAPTTTISYVVVEATKDAVKESAGPIEAGIVSATRWWHQRQKKSNGSKAISGGIKGEWWGYCGAIEEEVCPLC